MTINDLTSATFHLPCIFNQDGLGYRRLTSQEVLTSMDFPKGVCDHSHSESMLAAFPSKDLANIVPLKALQHVTKLLAAEEHQLPQESKTSTKECIQLAPTMPNMNLIYQEISQAKATKNDNATANTQMWDDSVLNPPKDFSDD